MEPDKIPSDGTTLLTIISCEVKKPDWNKIKSCIGGFKPSIDPSKWQREIRGEWEDGI